MCSAAAPQERANIFTLDKVNTTTDTTMRKDGSLSQPLQNSVTYAEPKRVNKAAIFIVTIAKRSFLGSGYVQFRGWRTDS